MYELRREPDGDGGWRIITADKCLWEYVTDFVSYLADLHLHYKNGFLLYSGGIGDQPNWYIMAITIMERAISGEMEKARKRNMENSKS